MAELETFLSGFQYDDEDAGGGGDETVRQRHAREVCELKERVRALKASAKKAEREAVVAQIASLEAEQRARHARELVEAGLGALSLGDESTRRPKKGNKARERKEREEAERDARMADARKNAGPAKRDLENAQLCVQLAPLGLRVREVIADGHCLFRAVACQLTDADAQPADEAVWALRGTAVEHMRAHAADFLPFFEATESAPTLDAYCAEMATTAAWGGQLELRALAQALGRTLRVHQAGIAPVVMNGGAGGVAVELSYHQHAYGLGEHYNAVQPTS
ncbi:hypothetical protein KFE25_001155 [Diacronema lutheri]|uniref:OTU domain-containing protein n=1 Tax=Diacronema lutheri TaxID=2081491 RepID=A0A8J5X9V3_DIALT|nr:hypothetical protein KFE25_001155 [Diacronema lutheri]